MTPENQTTPLTHLDHQGAARMVDVGDKAVTTRVARAQALVRCSKETLDLALAGGLKKGQALEVARLAGIMGAKKTSDLIPLCHPLSISNVTLDLDPDQEEGTLRITSTVRCEGRTGVEMEALTAVSIAALAFYDMVKAVDKGVVISDILLLSKSGGRSGDWTRP